MAKHKKIKKGIIISFLLIISSIIFIFSIIKLIKLDKNLVITLIITAILMIIFSIKTTFMSKSKNKYFTTFKIIFLSLFTVIFIISSVTINYFDKAAKSIIVKNNKKITKKDNNINKPITALILGIDSVTNNIKKSDSFNGDSIILATFNPHTLNTTLLSIPRDSYVKFACRNIEDKINSASMYGTECVIKTIEKLFDIKIDYNIKINFNGVMDLVNALGGIEVDVEYALCEQNSKRQFGKNMIFVEQGLQKLNGEQALAYARNRHTYKGKCPEKYTKGNRNDFQRGKHQKEIISAIVNKIKTIRDINTFNKIINSISRNMETNVSIETIYSLFNILNKNRNIVIDNMLLTGHDKMLQVNGRDFKQYFYILNDYSIEAIKNEMAINLEIKKPIIDRNFRYDSFYKKELIGTQKLNNIKNTNKIPDFTKMTTSEARNWGNQHDVCINMPQGNNKIYRQDIMPGTLIKNVKTCVNLEIEK